MYSHDRTIASAQVIDQLLPDLNADERKLAKEPGMGGRIWFGQGLVFDEAYGILMTLGILTDPKQAGKETANTSGQSTNQGWYNRFVQTGKSESETKTNGSFGGLEVGSVGSSWTGNLHPTTGEQNLFSSSYHIFVPYIPFSSPSPFSLRPRPDFLVLSYPRPLSSNLISFSLFSPSSP